MNYIQAKRAITSIHPIQGWFSKEAGLLIALLDEFQQSQHIQGDIFEIGVHHGKSTVFFSHLLSPAENIQVCDIFNSQENNVSHSGKGNKEIFIENMKRLALKEVKTIHTCLSSSLNPGKIGSGYRIFHIDGGHNANEALSDLELAVEVLHEKGMIILDDPFRLEWPGVTEAVIDFLKKRSDFVSVAVGFNKLIITRKNVAADYRMYLENIENLANYDLAFPISHKQLTFCETPLFIFYIPSFINPNSFQTVIKKVLRNSFLYKIVKPKKTSVHSAT